MNHLTQRGTRAGAPARGGYARRWIAAAALVVAVPGLVLYGGSGEWLPAIDSGMERLLQRQPTDPRSLIFQARRDMQAQRYEQAAAAYAGAVAGRSKAANDPGVWVEYAEARGMAQGGVLAGEPTRLVEKALELDGSYPQALDLAGSAAWELQNFGKAAAYWTHLLVQIPPTTARHEQLSLAIGRAQQRARMSLPPAAPQSVRANEPAAAGEGRISAAFAAALPPTGSAPAARR